MVNRKIKIKQIAKDASGYYGVAKSGGDFLECRPTILVLADLSGSASLPEEYDIDWASQVVIAHNYIFFKCFNDIDGKIIKEIGDEVMIRIDVKAGRINKTIVDVIKKTVDAFKTIDNYNKSKKYQIRSKAVIYWVGQAVERKKDFDGNQLNVPDLLGADINRAARILSVAKDNQMLINDEIVKKINKNVSIKNELLGQKINISEMHKLNGLKNIKGNVVVSEVSYKKAFLGIDEKYQDMLVFLDSKVETKHVFNKLINDINDWKNSNRVDAEGLLFSLILLGDRALAIRMKSLNLEKHRDCLIEMMKNCDVGMAHTYIIHSKIREITENLDKYRFKYGALLLFSFVVDKPETYKKFEKQIAQNNSRNTNVSILDAGTIFGDFEAYAIVDAKSHDDLYAFVHSTRNLPGMNDVETLVYPIVKLRQM